MSSLKTQVAVLASTLAMSACASSPVTKPAPTRQAPPTTAPFTQTSRSANAVAAARPQTESGIAPAVLAQIATLEQEKAARTDLQRRIDSRLLYAQRAATGRALVPGLRMELPRSADGRYLLDVRAEVSEALVEQIKGLGADVLEADPGHRALHIQAPLDQVEAIGGLPGVVFVGPLQMAHVVSRRAVDPAPRDRVIAGAALRSLVQRAMQNANVGSKTSQGDVTHRADTARSTYVVDGTGVKIGVLSNGVDGLAASQASGDLGPVTVLAGQERAGACGTFCNEGTAMLEIIHDLAPGAQLYFATASISNTSFANNIRALRAAGCDVIVDDVYYTNESPFQDGQAASVVSSGNAGVIAQAVKEVADSGVLYLSAAGNSGNKNDGTSGTWEGDFVDGGPAGGIVGQKEFATKGYTGRLHSFGGQNWNDPSTSSEWISLYWSDPLGASSNDYDLFLVSNDQLSLTSYSNNVQDGSQDPYENMSGGYAGNHLVVVKYAGSSRFLHLSTHGGALSISTEGATHGHAATTSANSLGVAATSAAGAYPNSFSGTNKVESFSADGPRRIFFNGDGSAITPENFSSTGGQVLSKPDITAADRVSVSGAGDFPTTFTGTSAAAAHAAAIAALVKSFNLSMIGAQVRTSLLGSAIDIEAAGLDRDSGVGIVMADAALQVSVAYDLFTDNPVRAGSTTLKASHITELRHYVDVLRVRYGLSAFGWSDHDLAAGTSAVRASHITELRAALNDVYMAAGRALPSYTAITAGTSLIQAIYLRELRTAVAAIY